MKKTISIIMITMLILLCVGCGKNAADSDTVSKQNTEQNTSGKQDQKPEQTAEQNKSGSFETIYCCDSPSKDKLALSFYENNVGHCDLNAILCVTYPDIAANMTLSSWDDEYPLRSDLIKCADFAYADPVTIRFADSDAHESDMFLNAYYDHDILENYSEEGDCYEMIDAENKTSGWCIRGFQYEDGDCEYDVCYLIPDTAREDWVHVFDVLVSSELINGISQKDDDLESCKAALEWCKEHVSFFVDQTSYSCDYDRISASTIYTDAEGNPLPSDFTSTMDIYTDFVKKTANINIPMAASWMGSCVMNDEIRSEVMHAIKADPEQDSLDTYPIIKDEMAYMDPLYEQKEGEITINGDSWDLYKYQDQDFYCAKKNISMYDKTYIAVIYFNYTNNQESSNSDALSKKDAIKGITMLYSD